MNSLWDYWHGWERAGGSLARQCRQDLHDRALAFERGADRVEKAEMYRDHPLYAHVACIPFWGCGEDGVDDPRISQFFERLHPDARAALVRLRVALELWQVE